MTLKTYLILLDVLNVEVEMRVDCLAHDAGSNIKLVKGIYHGGESVQHSRTVDAHVFACSGGK